VENLVASRSVRVAVVEDDAITRKMLVKILGSTPGFNVVAEFGEGQAAISSLAETLPDMFLVDLGLPDISGIQVVGQVARVCPDCDVLVITNFGDEQSVFSALEAGAKGYLLKGGTEEELRRDIASLREGGSPLAPAVARKVLAKLSNSNRVERNEKRVQAEYALTEREVKILELIGQGHSYDDAAQHCSIKKDTVHAHLKSIYRKLDVHSKTQAVFIARRNNIIS